MTLASETRENEIRSDRYEKYCCKIEVEYTFRIYKIIFEHFLVFLFRLLKGWSEMIQKRKSESSWQTWSGLFALLLEM